MKNFLAEALLWVVVFFFIFPPKKVNGEKASALLDILDLKAHAHIVKSTLRHRLLLYFSSESSWEKGSLWSFS